jgi:hypothetical protein
MDFSAPADKQGHSEKHVRIEDRDYAASGNVAGQATFPRIQPERYAGFTLEKAGHNE